MSNYATFEKRSQMISDTFAKKNFAIGCMGTCCILIIFMPILGFDIFGLITGTKYQDAQCYSNKNVLSLATWLILVNIVSIITIALIFMVAAITFCVMSTGSNTGIFTSIPIVILILMASIFSFVMNIVGIIELVYQFEPCKKEVNIVCVTVLITVILNSLGSFGSCYGIRASN